MGGFAGIGSRSSLPLVCFRVKAMRYIAYVESPPAPPARLGHSGAYPPRLFVTAHVHLLLVGFMLMIVMGVATWMFPRPGKDDPRYRPELAETVYWTMTAATALRAVAEVGEGLTGAPALRVLITLASLGQFAGAGLFVVNMWWRVRMPAVPPLGGTT